MRPTTGNETKAVESTPITPATRKTRANRIPVSGPRDILTITNKDPNYSYRYVNDVPGRIQRFLNGGWEFHVDPESEVGQRTVDSGSRLGSALTRQSGGITQVAMRIPKEWFDEDQQRKWDEIDSVEDSMRADGGNLQGMDQGARPDTATFGVSKGLRK